MATYQSVTTGDVIDVAPHMDRAARALAAAELLAREGFFADAVVRAHQSTVHAERALLATENRSPSTTWSVHRMATSHFHGRDELSRNHAPDLEALAAQRARVDEQPVGDADAPDAENAVGLARELHDEVRGWLATSGYLETDA